MSRSSVHSEHSEGGFTFVELLAVVLLLGILVLAALPNYFGAESDAKSQVDQTNVKAINATLALFRFSTAACPADSAAFDAFLGNTTYFPDGKPKDPYSNNATPYINTYSALLCRVQMSVPGPPAIDHSTGTGH